jgi:peptidoglycan/LPS O-acetylase OafA/YrhL
LAVEQQFYIFWPLLILLLPIHRLEFVILALVGLALTSRFALYATGHSNFVGYNVLPFANLDSLGLGAMVAVWSHTQQAGAGWRYQALTYLAGISAAALIGLRFVGQLPADPEQSLYAVVFAWIVGGAWLGFKGPLGKLLELRPLVWLGIISYGVYVYHMFAPRIIGAAMRAANAPEGLQSGIPLFIASAVLTLIAAGLSWSLLERPILQMRRGSHKRLAQLTARTSVARG